MSELLPARGRVLHALLSPEAVDAMRAAMVHAPFTDGRATAHGAAREVKHNQHLDPSHPVAREHGGRLLAALARHEDFRAAAWPHTLHPFAFTRYDTGMGYGDHFDLPIMGSPSGPLRTDLSLTVFLTSPEDYDGGDLVLDGPGGEERVRLPAGDAFLYPSDTLHRVEPVTRGSRLVALTWIQSLVADASARALITELAATIRTLHDAGTDEATLRRLARVQHGLLRRWASC